MSETKHTPGPWEIVDKGQCIAIVMAKHLRITVDHRENFGSATPDASLIAAAPELLALAKGYERYLIRTNGDEILLGIVQEIIAKAEWSKSCQPSAPAIK